jgi:hypothetical protein
MNCKVVFSLLMIIQMIDESHKFIHFKYSLFIQISAKVPNISKGYEEVGKKHSNYRLSFLQISPVWSHMIMVR